MNDTRELTRAGIRSCARQIEKYALEDQWDVVRIYTNTIVGLLKEEGL